MQVTIAATSSMLDNNTVLIETSVTIGEKVTTTRVGYDRTELMDNRFLSGSFEDRVEALRQSAERLTENSVRLHFQALAKIATPEPVVTEVTGFSDVGKRSTEKLNEKLAKAATESPPKAARKTRAKKTTESAQ